LSLTGKEFTDRLCPHPRRGVPKNPNLWNITNRNTKTVEHRFTKLVMMTIWIRSPHR